MTLVLELPAELENDLRADAKARGVAVEAVAVERLRGDKEAARRALVQSLRGRFKGRGPSVDEFLAERSAEAQAEARETGA